MHLLFLLDPLPTLSLHKDTSIVFMEYCLAHGDVVHVAGCDTLSINNGIVSAHTQQLLSIARDKPVWWRTGEPMKSVLHEQFDWVMMRKDPPVDTHYIHITYLLDVAVRNGTRVYNNPTALRTMNEKITATWYPHYAPKTLVSGNKEQLYAFLAEKQSVVVKPVDGMGGQGIFQIHHTDKNTAAILDTVTQGYNRTIIMQQLLAGYVHGDKRVFVVHGEVVPKALLRIPSAGEARANLAQGGVGQVVDVSEREQEIATAIAPDLLNAGVVFAGLDFIDEYLTEVNVTSPTCVREVELGSDENISERLLARL